MAGLDEVLRYGWLSLIAESVDHAIRPAETPTVHASGPFPYRILLVGGGIAIGLGVTRRDLALPGHIARHLASITGRGVDVDVSARLGMTLSDARTELDRRDLIRYDAIILTLGVADALARLPRGEWRSRVELLLVALVNGTPPQSQIVVAGGDSSSWSPYLSPLVTGSAARRLDEFNRVSRELCRALPRTSYFPPVPKRSAEASQYSVLDYDRAGRAAAAHLAQRLAHGSPSTGVQAREAPACLPTLAALGLLDLAPNTLIDHVVTRTRAAFGVEGATLTVLGPGHVWQQSCAGREERTPTPRLSSVEAMAAAERGGLAVRDLREDPRFRGTALATRHRIAFYAGYPIYAQTGECVAVLAILDHRARVFSPQDMALLRDHALIIQDALSRAVPTAGRNAGKRERPPSPESPPAPPTLRSPRHA